VRERSIVAVFLALVGLVAPAIPGGAADEGTIQQMLDRRVAAAPGSAIVVGVIDGATTTVSQAGASGTSRPLDEHTLFEIGSVTKTFTATILASMVMDRSVALDDPVAKYVPPSARVPSRGNKQITLLNLATQHSGLPRLPPNFEGSAADPYAAYTQRDLYAGLAATKLGRDPGTAYEYSNFGVAVLGNALAQRAHTSYGALLQARVLRPLAMSETTSAPATADTARTAVPHGADGKALKPWSFDAIAPAGGIRSNVADMLKFVRCNMGAGALAQACRFAQQPRSTFPAGRIGLIWMTDEATRIVWHNGATAGSHAVIAIAPDRRRAVVVLATGAMPVDSIAFHILGPAALDEPDVQLDAATLDQYVGVYDFATAGRTLSMTIARRAGGLGPQLTGQSALDIHASARDRFSANVVNARLDFGRDPSGAVTTLTLRQNGGAIVFTRHGLSPVSEPSYPPVVALDAKALDEYAGRYRAAPAAEFVVKHEGDSLQVQLTGQDFYPVFASAKDRFYYKAVDAQLEFVRDAQGRVTSLVLHQNGRDVPAVRE
jgi:serine-type D-Ala-D-Ala carboxypeptidase/endopeptidase